MGENQALRDALEVAQRQLVEAENELRDVRERVRNLRSVVYGLKQIFEPGDAGRSFELQPAVEEAQAVQAGEDRVTRRRGEPSPTVRRAAQILADARGPMRMPDIIEEWTRRGWVDPTWRTPKSAINMIYQRALKSGLVDRMPDRSWVLKATAPDETPGDKVED